MDVMIVRFIEGTLRRFRGETSSSRPYGRSPTRRPGDEVCPNRSTECAGTSGVALVVSVESRAVKEQRSVAFIQMKGPSEGLLRSAFVREGGKTRPAVDSVIANGPELEDSVGDVERDERLATLSRAAWARET